MLLLRCMSPVLAQSSGLLSSICGPELKELRTYLDPKGSGMRRI